ncbi:urease accessory protein [Noviherbaspirillum saxi]|uniref:Urease accessory protein n=2 Tax=Noviherbaspirillum saxi TaxID=2320863 RepID=A0A3A3GDE5_9BURK|nr:urease accessory protein [Noviherbaspirillum saxi]
MLIRSLFIIAATLLSGTAIAHPGLHHADASFAAGFGHPFVGWDHLLAMLVVGIWAVQQKRLPALLMALAFPLMMAVGAAVAMYGSSFGGVETGIASSLALLGLLVAFAVRMPVGAGIAMVSVFGLMHGYAHGIEAPVGGSMLAYGAGFVLATLLLHLAGVLMGLAGRRPVAAMLLRASGAAVAVTGVGLLAFT